MATINTHKASPSTSRWSYAAYLSSSGGGTTRRQFTDRLYDALQNKGLRAFRDDDDELRRGEDIPTSTDIMLALQKAIEGSKVSIIVLSQKYASSRSRLDDLVMILKRRSSGHLVLPVFYGVDRSEVRRQTGSLEAVFRRHERKEYLQGKVQEWRMALKEVADLAGLELPTNILETDGSNIIHRVCVQVNEYVNTNNRAHPGRQDRRDSCASRRKRSPVSLDILQQHFGNKRKDVAKSLTISVSTLKRRCRDYGITRWPNQISNNVSGLPNPYGENNPLPTFNTLSTNGQITMENDVGGQNLEPNECQPDYFEDPNFQNTRIAVYGETEAAGGSSEWVFQPEGQTTQSTAYPNSNALVFPQPHIASEEVLNDSFHGNYRGVDFCENLIALEDLSISPFMEEYGFGSINQTIPLCSNPTPSQQLMMPPLIASQDTSSVMVKATYGHAKIGFKLSFASGIIQLKKEVSKRLEIKPGSFNLECKDADGDFILIACDDDVRQYLQLVTLWGNQVIKLFVLDKVLNTTKFWDNCGCDYCTLLRWKIPRYV